jgi:single-strand DNA-binding protein
MYLPKNEKERDGILHDNTRCEHGTRMGGEFAEKYYKLRPGVSFANVLTTADSLAFADSLSFDYCRAYRLAFVIRYMSLNGYDFPFGKTEVVTSDHYVYERNYGMLNKIMIIGNLGRDPELNVTGDGTPVAKFSVAVSRKYKDKEETEWFNVVAWRQLAEICDRYLTKGSKVYIEGRLSQRKYTDREGVQRTSVEIIANEMEMLTPKGGSGNGTQRKEEVESGNSDNAFLPDYPDDAS